MSTEYRNVRTISVVTEPEPEGPIIKLGIGERGIEEVAYIAPQDINRIRINEVGRYEADFELTSIGIHGKFAYVPNQPLKCELSDKTLTCTR